MLWARSRRLLVLACTLAAILAAGSLCGQRALVLPTFFGSGANGVLLTMLLPLAWASALADAFAARCQAVEARAAVRLGVLDGCLFVAAVGTAAASFAAVVVPGPALAGVGPVLVLSGVATVGTLRAGAAQAALLASALLIFTSVYGVDAPAGPFVRVLQLDGNLAWSVACGAALCVLACGLLLTGRVTTRLSTAERLG